MPLNVNGTETPGAADASDENAVEVAATKEGADVRASVEVSHTRRRWRVSAAVEWIKGQGAKVGGKWTWKF